MMNSFSFCLVLLLCMVGIVISSSCQNDCSNHGSCHNSVCECSDPYTGDDCSIYNKTVSSGKTYSGSADQQEWLYYNIHLTSPALMTWWLNRTSSSGDCDIWIQEDRFPVWGDYLARNTSTAPNLSLEVSSQNGGMYYVGVYGYRACSYNLHLETGNECESNCNSHGECQDGLCLCNTGYYGDACQKQVTVLTPSKKYSSQVARQEWNYYSYTPSQILDAMDWVLTKTGASDEDCDLYVRAGQFPTVWDFDERNWTVTSPKTVTQTEVSVGQVYYMGVYGFSQNSCLYDVKLTTVSPFSPTDCPNNCSKHGSCSSNVCHCTSGYTGDECETMTNDVVLGQSYDGYVGENAWNYYSINGDQVSAFLVSLNKTSSSGDPDLYVKSGEKPTRYIFDGLDISTNGQMSVTITNAQGNTWWVGIFGFYGSDYLLRVDGTETCACANSNHGSCDSGSSICVCNSGYAGDDCSYEVTPLTSTVPASNQYVTNNEWKYYSIQSDSTSAGSLSVLETATEGQVWVFVSHDQTPALGNYEYSDMSPTALHQVAYSTKSPVSGIVYIGVYGSPYIPEVSIDGAPRAYFNISCWVSDF